MQNVRNLIARFPFKTGITVGFLCFVIVRHEPTRLGLGFGKDSVKEAEFYPLSSFPMYSKFSSNPIYVYLTDVNDDPIACHKRLGVLASELKKKYDKELRIVAKREGTTSISKLAPRLKAEAGMVTLRWLRKERATEAIAEQNIGPILLHEVILRRDEGNEITKAITLVGEL
jgi:hypothetical protein